MEMRYGRTNEQWQELINAASESLKRTAKLRRDTNYTALNHEICRATGQSAFDFANAADRAAMGELLGDVVDATFDEHEVMLSALVMYIDQNRPGPGFYHLAASRGLLDADATPTQKEKVWIEQFNRAIDAYGRTRRNPRRGPSEMSDGG